MTPSEKKAIGNRIKELRINKGLRQKQCQIPYGDVTIQMISGWETGNVVPSIDSLIKISTFYNVTIDYIITGNKKDENEVCVYSYKDAIKYMAALINCYLFKISFNQSGSGETTIYTFDKTIANFIEELNNVINAKKSMKDEVYHQVIDDLINKYDIPYTKQ